MKKRFSTTIVRDGSTCFVPIPFDPRPVFGKLRAPVKVTLNGYTYRSTIASMGDGPCLPLRRSHREAAGLEGGEKLSVTIELDRDERVIAPPADLVKALKATPGAWKRWQELSYTHQREHVEGVEGARRAETRARRIESVVRALSARDKPARGGVVRRYAAFLRGVSPMNAKMPELVRAFEAAGFEDVKTVLASGNVVFGARAKSEAALEERIEAALEAHIGRSFLTLVRSIDALEELLEADPFRAFRLPAKAKRVVTFLRRAPKPGQRLPTEVDGARILAVRGREVLVAYVPSPRGAVFMALIEKTFGKDVSTRTWDTVAKVVRKT